MKRETQQWLAKARASASWLANRHGSVTIDDVRRECPPPRGADPRIMGAVFLDRRFTRTGFVNSSRHICHGRMIGIFTLNPAHRKSA